MDELLLEVSSLILEVFVSMGYYLMPLIMIIVCVVYPYIYLIYTVQVSNEYP